MGAEQGDQARRVERLLAAWQPFQLAQQGGDLRERLAQFAGQPGQAAQRAAVGRQMARIGRPLLGIEIHQGIGAEQIGLAVQLVVALRSFARGDQAGQQQAQRDQRHRQTPHRTLPVLRSYFYSRQPRAHGAGATEPRPARD